MGVNATRHKYVNRNPYPLCIRDKSGTPKLFSPGEWDEDPWWSRHLGSRKLTKEPLTQRESMDKKSRGVRLKGRKHRTIEFVPWQVQQVPAQRQMRRQRRNQPLRSQRTSACSSSCMVACEMSTQEVLSSDRWVMVGDTYFCKYCDWNTVDSGLLDQHFEAYHEGKPQNVDAEPNKEGD